MLERSAAAATAKKKHHACLSKKSPTMSSTVAKSASGGDTPHAVAHSNADNTRIMGVGQEGAAIAALQKNSNLLLN